MSESFSYRTSCTLSVLALILAITNIALISSNKNIQTEIGQRQETINNGLRMSQANQALAQILAEISVAKNDQAIHDLLTAQKITVNSKATKAADKSEKKD